MVASRVRDQAQITLQQHHQIIVIEQFQDFFGAPFQFGPDLAFQGQAHLLAQQFHLGRGEFLEFHALSFPFLAFKTARSAHRKARANVSKAMVFSFESGRLWSHSDCVVAWAANRLASRSVIA
jgi:hypothetical protein